MGAELGESALRESLAKELRTRAMGWDCSQHAHSVEDILGCSSWLMLASRVGRLVQDRFKGDWAAS